MRTYICQKQAKWGPSGQMRTSPGPHFHGPHEWIPGCQKWWETFFPWKSPFDPYLHLHKKMRTRILRGPGEDLERTRHYMEAEGKLGWKSGEGCDFRSFGTRSVFGALPWVAYQNVRPNVNFPTVSSDSMLARHWLIVLAVITLKLCSGAAVYTVQNWDGWH